MVKHERGIALVLLLIAVAVIGLVAATVVQAGAQAARRAAEDELLAVGRDLERALRSYRDSTPGRAVLGPRALAELLRDPRFPGLRRHLRSIPADPLTGSFDWGLVRSADGQIIGVHSLSGEAPIRQVIDDPEFAHFSGAKGYAQWVFGAAPRPAPPRRPTPPAAGRP
jgi:type II secretory pathway pseudopilin PulG